MDLETQKSFKQVGGKANLEKLRISVAGVFDYLTDQFVAYDEKDMMKVDKRLQQVDLIIGFNIKRFDMPVLAPYVFMPVESLPVLDLMEVIEQVRGHRVSLDSIAGPTLNQRKSGSGADALTLFQDGKIDELKRYCLDDVRLTRDIYEYGCREGKIRFTSTWDYKTYEVPVNWKEETQIIMQRVQEAQSAKFPSSLF
ncbi:MAG: hypothetical protein EXS63_08885 [Candidatus Omnitrophica bacterium]|nr:hypothetical protein [Candidatus Omnitrophota bacterium]